MQGRIEVKWRPRSKQKTFRRRHSHATRRAPPQKGAWSYTWPCVEPAARLKASFGYWPVPGTIVHQTRRAIESGFWLFFRGSLFIAFFFFSREHLLGEISRVPLDHWRVWFMLFDSICLHRRLFNIHSAINSSLSLSLFPYDIAL